MGFWTFKGWTAREKTRKKTQVASQSTLFYPKINHLFSYQYYVHIYTICICKVFTISFFRFFLFCCQIRAPEIITNVERKNSIYKITLELAIWVLSKFLFLIRHSSWLIDTFYIVFVFRKPPAYVLIWNWNLSALWAITKASLPFLYLRKRIKDKRSKCESFVLHKKMGPLQYFKHILKSP